MKTMGIIAEYNPFHNGHLYHLKESMKLSSCEKSVVIMSGNFVQRGEPAVLSKWRRAEIAVLNGVNLVLELPFIYACNSAEYFAKGGIKLLNELGIVTHISFGSENGSIEELQEVAKILAFENEDYKSALRDFLSEGISFPKARHKTIEAILGHDKGELLRGSNNILAIEYLKQLILTNSKITPVTLKREGDGYLDRDIKSSFASAMAIRKLLINEDKLDGFISDETKSVLNNIKDKPVSLENFTDLIKYRLLTMDEENLKQIFPVGEGLENRLIKVLRSKKEDKNEETEKGKNIDKNEENRKENEKEEWIKGYVKATVSKRYTETRIQRILIHTLLNLTKDGFAELDKSGEVYGRILGADSKGLELIGKIKEKCQGDFIILEKNKKSLNALSEKQFKILEFDSKASDVYNIVTGHSVYEGSDFTNRFYKSISPKSP